jgi:hypothetical protein
MGAVLAGVRIHPYALDHQMAKGVQKPPLPPYPFPRLFEDFRFKQGAKEADELV